MSDPFFDQKSTKTHTKQHEPPKAKSVTITLYPDEQEALNQLADALARLTDTRANRSTATRTAISYALSMVKRDEKKILKHYKRSRSRR